MNIATDTNVLLGTTLRRLLTCIQEQRGARLIVLPTVNEQMHVHLPKYLARQARKRLKHDPYAKAMGLDRALEAVREAATQWWTAQPQSNTSMLEFIDPKRERAGEYRRICNGFDEEWFRDDNDKDAELIAEALLHGVPLVLSTNYNSIAQAEVTDHIRKRYGGTTSISTVGPGIRRLAEHDGRMWESLLAEGVCLAIRPNERRTPEKVTNTIEIFTENLVKMEKRTKVPRKNRIGEMTKTAIEGISRKDIAEMASGIMSSTPRHARDAEHELHQRTTAKLRSASYGR